MGEDQSIAEWQNWHNWPNWSKSRGGERQKWDLNRTHRETKLEWTQLGHTSKVMKMSTIFIYKLPTIKKNSAHFRRFRRRWWGVGIWVLSFDHKIWALFILQRLLTNILIEVGIIEYLYVLRKVGNHLNG